MTDTSSKNALDSAFKNNPDLKEIYQHLMEGAFSDLNSLNHVIQRLSEQTLFLELIKISILPNLQIETFLIRLRTMITHHFDDLKAKTGFQSVLSALAHQCFVNEYVYFQPEDELVLVELKRSKIEKSEDRDQLDIAHLACYKPLNALSNAALIGDNKECYPDIEDLIHSQILMPRKEAKIKDSIQAITPLNDETSKLVQSQYEDNPYPRWISCDLHKEGQTIAHVLEKEVELELKNYNAPVHPEILIAGCGTGQHALLTATRFSNAKLLAIDLSFSSLAYAIRKANEIGVENIAFAQADLIELGKSQTRFDLIESVGVLQHLEKPLEGWSALTKLLKPQGLMKVGLYSQKARRDIEKGRNWILENKFESTPEDMRKCRAEIIRLGEKGNKDMLSLSQWDDFYTLSTYRDLLMHECEHCFSIGEIEQSLEELGLEFLGFEITNKHVLQIFKQMFPDKNSTRDLKLWAQFEEKYPDTFASLYQIWCRKI